MLHTVCMHVFLKKELVTISQHLDEIHRFNSITSFLVFRFKQKSKNVNAGTQEKSVSQGAALVLRINAGDLPCYYRTSE